MKNVVWSNNDQSLFAKVPNKQLLNQSLCVVAAGKQFSDWSPEIHAESYLFMQHMAQAWTNGFTDQYLIYGKICSKRFKWEMVPYMQCCTSVGRAIQQLQVLWRTVFGGFSVSKEEAENQLLYQQSLLLRSYLKEASDIDNKSNDPFCMNSTIDNQWVITGNKVNVLFNYAPIGFGGEKLHFLVVPKQHRKTFVDVTQGEYCESLELTARLVAHFTENRKNIKNVYLLNKTGIDTGQTVDHWHLHVIFSSNKAQDCWGKITVVKNILLGSSPMKKSDLAERVSELRTELAELQDR